MTPKAIANRIKAKGLQKLRWYCQMCQKQCRDENGFKCHLTSESHQRQLLLFADDPDKYIDTFSQEFLDMFLELLKRRFGTKRVQANNVYQEYISDREHTHMNATQWETLTDFVQWVGKEGHCVVDETEKGWFIAYIDRDPETIRRQELLQKKEKMELDDEERTAQFVQKQIERAAASARNTSVAEFTALQRDNDEEKLVLTMSTKKPEVAAGTSRAPIANAFKVPSGGVRAPEAKAPPAKSSAAGQKRKSALDEIMAMEEQKKEKVNRRDYWLHKDIVVKVVTKKLGEKYYKKKAVVRDVIDNYGAVIKMLDGGEKLKVDQAHLETVIPATGKSILIVNGAYRGQEATLDDINTTSFSCTVTISSGPLKGRVLNKIQYEDISKIQLVDPS